MDQVIGGMEPTSYYGFNFLKALYRAMRPYDNVYWIVIDSVNEYCSVIPHLFVIRWLQ